MIQKGPVEKENNNTAGRAALRSRALTYTYPLPKNSEIQNQSIQIVPY